MNPKSLAGTLNAGCTEVHEIGSPHVPENPIRSDSKDSKRSRGSKRPGAGRKPNLAKRVLAGVKAKTAADILAGIDTQALVDDLLKNGSRQLKWQVLTALWERVYGKPKQDVIVSGGIVHAHTRDPFLASLPKEALEALARTYDELLAKHAVPVLEVAQDGSQNQVNSSTAIEAEVVTEAI
jgi:hypothetical protein